MSYKELFDHVQGLGPKVSRNVIRDKVLEITGLNRIAMAKTTLDTTLCRGFFCGPQNTTHKIVQQLGSTVIVVARSLNYCWERFVFVKELMHALDGVQSATDSGDKFETCLSELMIPGAHEWSPQMVAEIDCFWRALAVLCPEPHRLRFKADLEKGLIDHYAIALQLRIPQGYVPRLFVPDYSDRIADLF